MQKTITKAASEGFRVLGVAIAQDGGAMKHINEANVKTELNDATQYPDLESGCGFVGYICIKDPVRDEVKESIQQCRTAGVNVIMITGDAKETAIAIANELQILSGANSATAIALAGVTANSSNQQQLYDLMNLQVESTGVPIHMDGNTWRRPWP